MSKNIHAEQLNEGKYEMKQIRMIFLIWQPARFTRLKIYTLRLPG